MIGKQTRTEQILCWPPPPPLRYSLFAIRFRVIWVGKGNRSCSKCDSLAHATPTTIFTPTLSSRSKAKLKLCLTTSFLLLQHWFFCFFFLFHYVVEGNRAEKYAMKYKKWLDYVFAVYANAFCSPYLRQWQYLIEWNWNCAKLFAKILNLQRVIPCFSTWRIRPVTSSAHINIPIAAHKHAVYIPWER